MDLTPKQQTSEAIRQAETILILTGQHPSVDQVTAVIALAAILRKFGKTATAVISDNPPASIQALEGATIERNFGGSRDFVLKLDVTKVEVDKLRYEVEDGKLNIYLTPFKGSFAPSDVTFGYGKSNINYDLTIVLGVPTRARIDRLYEQNSVAFENIPLVNLDFHRSNESYGAVNLIEPNASSLCEMLVALSESLQSGIIDGEIATALLMGIVASTDRFTAAHTSPKSLTVAAQMMAAGARQQAVVKALYRDSKPENRTSDRRESDRNDARASNDRRDDRSNDRTQNDRRDDRSNDRRDERTSERNERVSSPAQSQTRPQSTAQPQAAVTVSPPRPAVPPPQAETPPQQPNIATTPPAATTSPVSVAATQPQMRQPSAQVASTSPEMGTPASAEAGPYDDVPIIQPGHIELSIPEPEPQSERPQAMPMADFAAAAEMFNLDPSTSELPTNQDVS